jgi:hypothetical protein
MNNLLRLTFRQALEFASPLALSQGRLCGRYTSSQAQISSFYPQGGCLLS